MNKKKHYHVIGSASHYKWGDYNFRLGSELEMCSTRPLYYKFCNECGTKITKAIIKEQESL